MTPMETVTIWYNGAATPRIQLALDVFRQTICQRSQVEVQISADLPADKRPVVVVSLDTELAELKGSPTVQALGSELIELVAPGPEGYRLGGRGKTMIVSGADERGLLYGLGRLLRRLEIRERTLTLTGPILMSTTPRASLRGHQLGYRPKTNAYDMWSKDQYRQYIVDLALFGANAVELMPPRTDDESRTPEMLYDQLEMMSWLSKEIHDLGLDVWIWYPNMADDYSVPATIEAEAAERREVFSSMPHIDAVMIPGGDPGHQEAEVLFRWGQTQAEILREFHPNAGLWISAQVSDATPGWLGAFLREIGKEPDWLTGLCHGPWVKGDVAEFRAAVPPKYAVRRYPDITHSLSCQYPVRDWDPVFAGTLGRECYNPRPLDHKRIHNAYADHAAGCLTYSEGINDDVNKFIWSDQDWDPSTPVRDTLRDFARLFISPDHVEPVVDGLLGFEQNWRGPVSSNPSIRRTFDLWRGLETALADTVRSNYRLTMPLMRAYYDEYVRRRLHRELGLEEQVVSLIEGLSPKNVEAGLSRIKELLAVSKAPAEFDPLKTRCTELADTAFELIRWQTSVVRHKGQAIRRGCFLDAIDFQISDLPFYAAALERAAAQDELEARCSIMKAAMERARPRTLGRLWDLAFLAQTPEMTRDRRWEEDPSGLTLPFVSNMPAPRPSDTGDNGQKIIPMIERCYATAFYCRPIRFRLDGLDPRGRYRVRVRYQTYRQWSGTRLTAGPHTIHDFIIPDKEDPTRIYSLPPGSISGDGSLELVWQTRPFRVYSEGIAWVIVEPDAGDEPKGGTA